MATLGGGAFFGKSGSFEEGYEFDAVVRDDASLVYHPGTECNGTPGTGLYIMVWTATEFVQNMLRGEQIMF